MKLSRRKKSARRVRHTKRAGKKLRYKSKKFRALKKYHRRGGRHTKKLYGRRVKKGGEVIFDIPTSSGEPSESGYTYNLTGTIKSELRYKKIGFSSVTSDTSPFDIEIIASRNRLSGDPIIIKIKFTRKKLPKVTYTINLENLNRILESITDPKNIKPQIPGIDEKNVQAEYEFSFKDNEVDFKTIKTKVNEIKDSILNEFSSKQKAKIAQIRSEIQNKIENDRGLKIIIPYTKNNDKKINYPAEIEKLQKQVDDFREKNPNHNNNPEYFSKLMDQISVSLLDLLVAVYLYQNYDSNGEKLQKPYIGIGLHNRDKPGIFDQLERQLYDSMSSNTSDTQSYQYGPDNSPRQKEKVNNTNGIRVEYSADQLSLFDHYGIDPDAQSQQSLVDDGLQRF